MTKKWKRRKDFLLAILYVILGLTFSFAMGILGMAMWTSPTFLPGINANHLNWWIRKLLYVLLLILMGVGVSLADYGFTYLQKRLRR